MEILQERQESELWESIPHHFHFPHSSSARQRLHSSVLQLRMQNCLLQVHRRLSSQMNQDFSISHPLLLVVKTLVPGKRSWKFQASLLGPCLLYRKRGSTPRNSMVRMQGPNQSEFGSWGNDSAPTKAIQEDLILLSTYTESSTPWWRCDLKSESRHFPYLPLQSTGSMNFPVEKSNLYIETF